MCTRYESFIDLNYTHLQSVFLPYTLNPRKRTLLITLTRLFTKRALYLIFINTVAAKRGNKQPIMT